MTAEELGQMIWNVKELLRNVYDNKDVEDVILPFTLLRRLDCVLVGSESRVAANMKQLEELGQTSQEDIDNKHGEVVFCNSSALICEMSFLV